MNISTSTPPSPESTLRNLPVEVLEEYVQLRKQEEKVLARITPKATDAVPHTPRPARKRAKPHTNVGAKVVEALQSAGGPLSTLELVRRTGMPRSVIDRWLYSPQGRASTSMKKVSPGVFEAQKS